MTFKPATYEEAKEKLRRRQLKQKPNPKPKLQRKTFPSARKSSKRKAKDKLEVEFRRVVRERDNYRCQWPGCTVQGKYVHVHHIAPRSRRPDLVFDPMNGVCVCFIHHDFLHHNAEGRRLAKLYGLLNYDDTYENRESSLKVNRESN